MKHRKRWFILTKTVNIPALMESVRLTLFCQHEWEPAYLTVEGREVVVGKECRVCGRLRSI